ncbi:uncharacterized protein CELE_Y53H1C.3 [Caenorhabditis elegans]|uniref:Domain of unknown function WSN domain-containing protein n=1 Tax=Caenorhabditis elegans TaxID=6239 RepID=G5EFP0_CAEEL|nr:protein of unknown function WSN domain-containing protein [Caenorhabditis elegans]CAB55065.2 Domain of unknown function WSN domain-containing protein [Caenorhabditis elegans]|eukprot:NP_492916.1 Uncharacterized protein CELE_Y53H1C.3 [Caenorhabditis elegans]
MISQILNAMSIQKGLISGTLDPETLISELLGSALPSELASINMLHVQQGIEIGLNIPKLLRDAAGDENAKARKAYEGYNAILKEIDGMIDVKNWSGKADFDKGIAELRKDYVKPKVLENLEKICQNLTSILNSATLEADQLSTALEALTSLSTSFNATSDIWMFHEYTSTIQAVAPFLKTARGVEEHLKYKDNLNLTKKEEAAFNKYISIYTNSAVHMFLDLGPLIGKIFAPEGHNKSLSLPEFDKVLSDAWIRSVVNSDSLGKGLSRLSAFQSSLLRAQRRLNFTDVAGGVRSIIEMFNFDVFPGDDHMSAADQECTPLELRFRAISDLKMFIDEIEVEFNNLTMLAIKLSFFLSGNSDAGQDFLKIHREHETVVIKKLNETGQLKSLKAHLSMINQQLELINTFPIHDINVYARYAQLDIGWIYSQHKDELEKYADYFNCLQNNAYLKYKASLSIATKRISDHVYNSTYQNSFNNLLGVFKNSTSAVDDMFVMKRHMKAMKNFHTVETDALGEFKDVESYAENLRLAVQGLEKLSDLVEKKDQLKYVIDNINVLIESVSVMDDVPHLYNLQKIVLLKSEFRMLHLSLEGFEEQATDSIESIVLEDYEQLFVQARSIPSIEGDFEAIGNSVGELARLVTNVTVKEILRNVNVSLNSLDLDFTSYRVHFANVALRELDVFFANFSKKFEKPEELDVRVEQKERRKAKNPNERERLDRIPWWFVFGCVTSILFGALFALA